ncbi:hypothetical protein BGP77_06410 [Saccharospirillum sp. MSK14-1]|uniref:hypothetical protein n=1 Tax=Saccharospirillum sp. MSK14-1 TaxID=1897632 RepID=UPI000D3C5724|nr:hypothetical protein [Saccharospirillum sp. MSK14-1]PTY36913.1 hypothetical protein BGP77_06410 [Saccharospirillum sp. MSK14-1]
MTHHHRAPDIEIYLKGLAATDLEQWLAEQLDDLAATKRVAGMPKNARPFQGIWEGERFTILVIEKVVDGFTSLWLNSPELPWRDDQECAQAAAAHFQREVRIAADGWQEGAEPDAWISIAPDGSQTNIQWQTEHS